MAQRAEISFEIQSKWSWAVDFLAQTLQISTVVISRRRNITPRVIVANKTAEVDLLDDPRLMYTPQGTATIMQHQMRRTGDSFVDGASDDHASPTAAAYLGIPLSWPDGTIFGTLSGLDSQLQAFTSEQITTMRQFGAMINGDLHLLDEIKRRQRAENKVRQLQNKFDEPITGHNPNRVPRLRTELVQRKQMEEKLRKLSRVVEQSPIIVLITDTNGKIEYVNPKFTAVTGYTQEEVTGKTPNILKSGATAPDVYEDLWRTILAGDVWRGEFCNRKKNGELYWEAAFITPLRNPDGAITHFVAVKEDITERRQMLLQVKTSEQRYRDLFENVPTGLFRSTPDGSLIDVNPAYVAMLGYPDAETLLKVNSRSLYVDPKEREAIIALLDKQGIISTREVQLLSYDGTPIWVEFGVRLVHDEDSVTQYMEGFAQDITARKQTETALRESEAQFRQFFETLPIPSSIHSEGIHILVNPACARLMGGPDSTPEDFVGTSIWPHVEHVREVAQERLNVLYHERKPTQRIEQQFLTRDGRLIDVLTQGIPMTLNGKAAAQTVFEDITERKRLEAEALTAETLRIELEKEKELIAFKERFVSLVTHEFRTPLAVIQSVSDMLVKFADKIDTSTKERKFQQIQDQITRLTSLTDNILTITRIRSGNVALNPEPLLLEPFCEKILEEIQTVDDGAHRFELISAVPAYPIMLDSTLLRHILGNLLSNAMKYSPEQSQIDFEVASQGNYLTIRISDQGIGIPDEDRKRLFEPFHRASNVGGIPGTGLGLSIVKQYVELHGGAITVDSEVGVGTTFHISLPL